MDEVERRTIELPAEGLAEALEAVETGEFPSLEAAVADALDTWTADRIIARIGIDTLRRRLQEAVDSGDPQPLDFEELKGRLAEALADDKLNG